jgi:threonine dehydratase
MKLSAIKAAAASIRDVVVRTPLVHSTVLSELAGADIYVKFENLQFTGSFKERGALNKLISLDAGQKAAGVIAMSAGNHAQAVAYHAQRLGIVATIVMPADTPRIKVRQTEHFGAEVIIEGESLSEAADVAQEIGKKRGMTFVHPYDDVAVIAGQGTIGLEMLEDAPELDAIAVPIGGGGLMAGIATAAKALKPKIEIIGVESERYPAITRALHGQSIDVGGITLAEGIAVKRPGERTLPIIKDLVDDIILVSEEQLERAVSLYITIEKTVAEGAGAATLAAMLPAPDRFQGKRVGIVLSGGNIDTRILASVLMRDLVHRGLIAELRIQIRDMPGALADVSSIVSGEGGNILEVHHRRMFAQTQVRETEIDLVVESRDPENMQEIIAGLERAGYKVRIPGL